MGRKSGSTPWHATALKLQAQGLSATQIHEALSQTAEPPNLGAIKKFLQRAKSDTGKALQIALGANNAEMPALPPLGPEDARTLTDLFLVVEKQRARLLGKAMARLEKGLSMSAAELAQDKDGLSFAIKVIETLKLPATQAPVGEGGGGRNDPDEPDGEDKNGGHTVPGKGEYLLVEVEGVDPIASSPAP